jgi:glutamate synthase domain-containing protein 3
LTGSPRARWILDNWYAMLPRFLKVFPHEFKRVLGAPRTADMPRITLARPDARTSQEAIHG